MNTFPLPVNLRKAMDARSMNTVQLSERSSVPQPRISDILREKVLNPRIKTVTKLAKALEVSIDDLVA